MRKSDNYLVGWSGQMEWADADEATRAADVLGEVMDHLLVCDGLIDPTIDLDGPNTVTFEAVVVGTDEIDALTRFSFLLRSCLHAAGIGTPHWQTADELVRSYARTFTPESRAHKAELLQL